MQAVSDDYIESMKKPYRSNRAYIRGTIGIINSDAQNSATVENEKNSFTYFSDTKKPFENNKVSRVYATAEQDFSKVDGSMYFLPKENEGLNFYNNGFVTEELAGGIYIDFSAQSLLDIRGMTIDFGECYPSEFIIKNDNTTYTYENNTSLFVTEDIFNGTSYITIIPQKMVNKNGRLRIHTIDFGVIDSFSNHEVMDFELEEFVSPTTETLPSKDVRITIDNQDSYYNPDNATSAISYLELGQEVKVSFGYDVHGDGNIEWLPEILTYLQGWNATDTQAEFMCVDLFASMEGMYYRGLYRENGISLYDLAVDVLNDAGFEPMQYYIDSYLKDVIVKNPVPPVRYAEALQIIANAGRCSLYDDRKGRIHLQASFKPDMTISSNGETDYSKVFHVLNDEKKDAYAIASNDFSVVDGSVLFMPKDNNYLNTGYISNYISDENGDFEKNPVLTITLEFGFVAYGFKCNFRNVKPKEFVIRTYYEESLIETLRIQPTSLNYDTQRRFEMFDRMEIEFLKNHPNSRIFVDNIVVGDVTNYVLTRNYDLIGSPTVLRQDKLKSMTILRNLYTEASTEVEIASDEIDISSGNLEHVFFLSDPAYDFRAIAEENSSAKVEIIESSSYYVKVRLGASNKVSPVRVILYGKEYVHSEQKHKMQHNYNGKDMIWDNPLVSSLQHAKDLEEWLSSYYLGEVDYQFDWRGDPRVDANDLFYLELRSGKTQLIRAYENSLSYNGAWSGRMKSRAVVM